MVEYAPAAIRAVFDALTLPGKQLSGILGDTAHTYGYHRGRDYVGPGDYSAELPPDLGGDGQAASALDVSLPPDQMSLATQRLMAAVSTGDPRTAAVREFYGTIDGRNVVGWDQWWGSAATSDETHLWHVHLSIYRQWCNDAAVLLPIADVMNGAAGGPAMPALTLTEVGMFLVAGPAGVTLFGPGYQKNLSEEQFNTMIQIPGMQIYQATQNQRAVDLIVEVCTGGLVADTGSPA